MGLIDALEEPILLSHVLLVVLGVPGLVRFVVKNALHVLHALLSLHLLLIPRFPVVLVCVKGVLPLEFIFEVANESLVS